VAKRVTIADVAKKAGVSVSTVSYALSNKRPISEETRQRIHQAIDELDFRPNAAAKRLRNGVVSRNIGFVLPLVMPEITRLEMKFITGASKVINQADYAFILLAHTDRSPDNLLRFIQSGLVDGFILMEVYLRDARVEMLQRERIPFVLVGRCEDNTDLAYVDTDIQQWVELSIAHLAGLGHHAIAFLHRDVDVNFGYAVRMLEEYEAACARYGIRPILQPCELSPEGGKQAANILLDQHPETTAVIVWSDVPTIGVVEAAHTRGRHVPDDFYIICQEHSIIADLPSFVPTIIDVQADKLTAEAARLLIEQLEGKEVNQTQILIPPKLTLRVRD
jgi:DNA-binding LacI/PurR family transcriptional regulator